MLSISELILRSNGFGSLDSRRPKIGPEPKIVWFTLLRAKHDCLRLRAIEIWQIEPDRVGEREFSVLSAFKGEYVITRGLASDRAYSVERGTEKSAGSS